MVLPLPGALASFSSAALKSISALDAITKSIGDVQAIVSKNISDAATAATTGAGSLFESIPSFIGESNDAFLSNIVDPKALSTSLQQSSLSSVSGITSPTSSQVGSFVANNVRLEEILPAHQMFQTSKSMGNAASYADPMQAYAHTASGAAQIKNLCQEAELVIAKTQADVAGMLSAQIDIGYEQFASMGQAFFAGALTRIGGVISAFSSLCGQLSIRGKFEPASVAAFCSSSDSFENFVTFGSAKVKQFELLTKAIQANLLRLSQILTEMLAILQVTKKAIPDYTVSVEFGPLFKSVQSKVCAQADVDLKKILKDIEAFSEVKSDDRAKVEANFAWAAGIESIKAFVCGLQPATEVTNPAGEFASLSTAFDSLAASLSANDPTALFEAYLSQVPAFASSMLTGVTKDNSVDLSASAASILGTLATLTTSLTLICGAVTVFTSTFTAQTSINPDRLVGPMQLYDNIGADNAKNTSLMKTGDTTDLNVSESTTPGQLSEAMRVRIEEMPDGNEKDQLTLARDQVQSRHHASVLAMDFQRRMDVESAFAVDEAEANRKLVNKATKTFSGLEAGEFDDILV